MKITNQVASGDFHRLDLPSPLLLFIRETHFIEEKAMECFRFSSDKLGKAWRAWLVSFFPTPFPALAISLCICGWWSKGWLYMLCFVSHEQEGGEICLEQSQAFWVTSHLPLPKAWVVDFFCKLFLHSLDLIHFGRWSFFYWLLPFIANLLCFVSDFI